MELAGSLSNQLLIAMPGLADPNFSSTVTLVCEHNAEGALGVIVNRPTTLNLGGLFEQLALTDADQEIANYPVLSGGPVARERGFVLHNPGATYDSSVAVSPDIHLTLSRDVLDAKVARGLFDDGLVALEVLEAPRDHDPLYEVVDPDVQRYDADQDEDNLGAQGHGGTRLGPLGGVSVAW